MARRDSARVQRTRLAGRETVGLDDAFIKPERRIAEQATGAVSVDFGGLGKFVEERGIPQSYWRLFCENAPRTEIASALGWTYQRVRTVEKRLMAILANRERAAEFMLTGSSLETAVQTGAHWSLSRSNDQLPFVLAQEKHNYFSPKQQTSRFWAVNYGGFVKLQADLERKLNTARQTLERVIAESDEADAQVRTIQKQLDKIAASVDSSVAQILAGEKPKPQTEKFQALTLELERAEETARLYRAAVEQAQNAVESVKQEIQQNQGLMDVAAFAPEIERWDAAVKNLLDVHESISAKIATLNHGVDLTDVFFPLIHRRTDLIDWRLSRERFALMGLYNAAASLLRQRKEGTACLYDRRKERAA